MERLRILAAAAALNVFTPKQLSAYAGANENTVRSLLRRERHRFMALAEPDSPSRPGRPPTHYQLTDLEHVRTELSNFERAVAVREVSPEVEQAAAVADRMAAIIVAENAVLRAQDAKTPREQAILALMAQESLAQAKAEAQAHKSSTEVVGPDALDRRAEAIGVFAELALMRAHEVEVPLEQLARAARALAELAEVAPANRVQAFFGQLVDAAISSRYMPPLWLVTEEKLGLPGAIPELDELGWLRRPIPNTREVLWAQRWAEPVLERGFIAGLVIHDSGYSKERLRQSLARFADRHLPTVVLSRGAAIDKMAQVAAAGAVFVPESAGVGVVTAALRSGLVQLGVFGWGASLVRADRELDSILRFGIETSVEHR
jgi:hypothetical protein